MKGTKRWSLKPPPECYWECPAGEVSVTLDPGDIIVVNTNWWSHSTLVLGADISVTITNEYEVWQLAKKPTQLYHYFWIFISLLKWQFTTTISLTWRWSPIWGTHFGETNDVASMVLRPAAANRLMNSIFTSAKNYLFDYVNNSSITHYYFNVFEFSFYVLNTPIYRE